MRGGGVFRESLLQIPHERKLNPLGGEEDSPKKVFQWREERTSMKKRIFKRGELGENRLSRKRTAVWKKKTVFPGRRGGKPVTQKEKGGGRPEEKQKKFFL